MSNLTARALGLLLLLPLTSCTITVEDSESQNPMPPYRQPPFYVPNRPGSSEGGSGSPEWQGNLNYGNEVAFGKQQVTAPDGSITYVFPSNNRQKVLQMDASAAPEQWNISLDIKYDEERLMTEFDDHGYPTGDPAPGELWSKVTDYSILAEVTIGSGGATQTFQVDWRKGVSFSATFNSVNIVAIFRTPPNQVPPDLKLCAMLGHGGRAAGNPTLTQIGVMPPAAPGSSARMFPNTFVPDFVLQGSNNRIPRFARSVQVMQYATEASPIWTANHHFIMSRDSYQDQYRIPFDEFSHYGGNVPIPGDAKYWNLVNLDTDFHYVSLIFNLGL